VSLVTSAFLYNGLANYFQMARVEGRKDSYAKAHHLVTVARVLASVAVLMDTVRLVAKVSLVTALVVTFRRMVHVVVLSGICVPTVRLGTAARAASSAAQPPATVGLNAKVTLALALGTATSHLTELVVARRALRAEEVASGIAALRSDTVAAQRLTARLDVRRRLEHVPLVPTRSRPMALAEEGKV
jgi:hypothetical protein